MDLERWFGQMETTIRASLDMESDMAKERELTKMVVVM